MTLVPLSHVVAHFVDDNNAPLVGGRLEAYTAQTTIPTDFYNSAGTTLGATLKLNGRGEPSTRAVFVDAAKSYKFRLLDASGVQIWEIDNINWPFVLARQQPSNNYAANRDPSGLDDSTQGYLAGSWWFNSQAVPTKLWRCLSAASGSAVWEQMLPKSQSDNRYLQIIPGAVQMFAMSAPPAGWLKANGAAISRTTYAALYSAIGTTFGTGNGTTTFNLPDLRGEFVRGYDDGRGVDSGRTFGSSQADDFANHDHPLLSDGTSAALLTSGTSPNNSTYSGGSTPQHSYSLTGKRGGNETRPRNIALLYCIKF